MVQTRAGAIGRAGSHTSEAEQKNFPSRNSRHVSAEAPAPARGQFDRVKQIDLVQQIIDQLRPQILSGQFGQNGELPTETELGASFGVSRTVAREAMRTLRAQGLVEVSRGRRSRVIPVNPQAAIESLQVLLVRAGTPARHLHELRRLLVLEMAGLAAERATEADLAHIESILDELATAKSLKKQRKCERLLYEALAAATGNSLFPMLLSTITPLLENALPPSGLPNLTNGSTAYRQPSILEALHNRNAVEARQAMADHLATTEDPLPSDELNLSAS